MPPRPSSTTLSRIQLFRPHQSNLNNTLRSPFRSAQAQTTRRQAQTLSPNTSAAPVGGAASNVAPQSLLQRLWTSEVGVKTVHFWAPVMKWCLVIAGVGDFFRPAEKLSLTQNGALTATGTIWTRWCLIIKPKNYLLAAVNFALAIVGTVQVSRILSYRSSIKGGASEAVEASKEEEKEAAKEVVKT